MATLYFRPTKHGYLLTKMDTLQRKRISPGYVSREYGCLLEEK
uniref:Uncharacterized protein n=1 Tax=Meloidogyne enterolobii TaxID=390850 RepID=A0A6V7TYE2_MELEN|nr:unnamed protein product [Meloidogyne enterolobii]